MNAEIFCNSIGLLLELLHLGVQHQLLHGNQMMVNIRKSKLKSCFFRFFPNSLIAASKIWKEKHLMCFKLETPNKLGKKLLEASLKTKFFFGGGPLKAGGLFFGGNVLPIPLITFRAQIWQLGHCSWQQLQKSSCPL